MIYLTATTDKLDLITSAAAAVDVNANYIDASASGLTSPAGGRQNTAISTATTTDVLSAPGASTTRTLKQMTIRNKDATLSCDVTLRFNQNGTAFELHKLTLNPGECLIYIEGVGFFELTNTSANRLLTNVEPSLSQRIFRSALPTHAFAAVGGFVCVSGTAYYVYVGRTVQDVTVKFVEFHITGAGAGTDTKEVGLFSTPTAPGKSTQTLTKIVATGTVDSGTTTGAKRNTSSFAQLVPAGTHLWAALRTALATTQPTVYGLEGDMSQGHVLTTTGGGALTGLTTASGSLVAIGTGVIAPDLRVTID